MIGRIIIQMLLSSVAEKLFDVILEAVDELVNRDDNELDFENGKKVKEIILDAERRTAQRRHGRS